MTNLENEKAIAYQHQMQALYANEAEAKFKKEFWPADPFDTGILIDATYLEVDDLAVIYKAAKKLRDEGNDFLSHDLIMFKRSQKGKWEPTVKVNPLYFDGKRQRMIEISQLFYRFFWEDCASFLAYREKVLGAGDPQLEQMVRQVEEALGLTKEELEVMK